MALSDQFAEQDAQDLWIDDVDGDESIMALLASNREVPRA